MGLSTPPFPGISDFSAIAGRDSIDINDHTGEHIVQMDGFSDHRQGTTHQLDGGYRNITRPVAMCSTHSSHGLSNDN
jgi:hypothetical protein